MIRADLTQFSSTYIWSPIPRLFLFSLFFVLLLQRYPLLFTSCPFKIVSQVVGDNNTFCDFSFFIFNLMYMLPYICFLSQRE